MSLEPSTRTIKQPRRLTPQFWTLCSPIGKIASAIHIQMTMLSAGKPPRPSQMLRHLLQA